jgi:hypothetical protein
MNGLGSNAAQRLTRIAGYRIGGGQSAGTGTILQTCHELASFQLVELHLIPRARVAGGTAAWPHVVVRHHRAQSPQYLSKQTSGGTIAFAVAASRAGATNCRLVGGKPAAGIDRLSVAGAATLGWLGVQRG